MIRCWPVTPLPSPPRQICGGSAGALEYAREHLREGDTMVVVLPDHGTRYLGKIYNDDWMRAQGWL